MNRSGIAVVLLLALALFAWVQLALPWSYLDTSPGDFGNYHAATQALAAGSSPYVVHNFDYPPLLAFLLLPLAPLPLASARAVWFGVSVLAMLAAAVVAWSHLGRSWRAAAAIGGVWILGGTLEANLGTGQVNPLLLLLLVCVLFYQRERPVTAGVLLGVAAALKLWPAAIGLAWLVHRRWRPLVAAAGVALTLVVVPLLVFALALPPPALPASAGYWLGTPAALNESASALALRLVERPERGARLPASWRLGNDPRELQLAPSGKALSLVVALVVLAGGASGLWWKTRGRRRDEGAERQAVLASLSLALVASPISWYHYQLLQWLPLAILAHDALGRRRWLPACGVVLLLGGLTRFPAWGFARYVATHGWTAGDPTWLWLTTSAAPLLGLLLVAILVWLPAGGAARFRRRSDGRIE